MEVHVPIWIGYVCGGSALFVAGMVTMFVIGLLAGRTKTAKLVEQDCKCTLAESDIDTRAKTAAAVSWEVIRVQRKAELDGEQDG